MISMDAYTPDGIERLEEMGVTDVIVGFRWTYDKAQDTEALQTKIDNLTVEMTYVSKEMIDYLIKGVSGEFGRSRFTREFNASSGSNAPLT